MFERTWTVQLPTGAGPAVYQIETVLPGGEPKIFVEAWGQAGALIIADKVDLNEAQERIAVAGNVDAVMTTGALAGRHVDLGNWLTVFFPITNASSGPQFVTVKVRQVAR